MQRPGIQQSSSNHMEPKGDPVGEPAAHPLYLSIHCLTTIRLTSRIGPTRHPRSRSETLGGLAIMAKLMLSPPIWRSRSGLRACSGKLAGAFATASSIRSRSKRTRSDPGSTSAPARPRISSASGWRSPSRSPPGPAGRRRGWPRSARGLGPRWAGRGSATTARDSGGDPPPSAGRVRPASRRGAAKTGAPFDSFLQPAVVAVHTASRVAVYMICGPNPDPNASSRIQQDPRSLSEK